MLNRLCGRKSSPCSCKNRQCAARLWLELLGSFWLLCAAKEREQAELELIKASCVKSVHRAAHPGGCCWHHFLSPEATGCCGWDSQWLEDHGKARSDFRITEKTPNPICLESF